jgi:hypothetical protein
MNADKRRFKMSLKMRLIRRGSNQSSDEEKQQHLKSLAIIRACISGLIRYTLRTV